MRALILLFALLLAGGAAQASALSVLDDESLGASNRYDRCLELTKRNAQQALAGAVAWQNAGGDGPATHCKALALIELNRYAEAAGELDRLGHQDVGGPGKRASVFDQAGNAWLLARQGGKAIASFSAALALTPRDPDILGDRARAAGLLRDWRAAESDLSAALAQDPNRADLLVLRASARHAMGHKREALGDLAKAFDIVPDYPDALVERGAWEMEAGNAKAARDDWRKAVARAPGSEAAAAATERLSALPQANAKTKPKPKPE